MNTVNRFFVGVLIVLLIVLGGLWIWQRRSLPLPQTPAPAAQNTITAKPPTPQASPAAREQYQTALGLKNQKKLAQARDALRQWLTDNPNSDLASEAEKTLGEINTQIILTPAPAPEKEDYTIQPNDSLAKIANKHNTTLELIEKSNRLVSQVIHPSDRLRIYRAKFSVVVDKTANTLTLLDDGKFFKKYRVGTGQYSWTPEGDFKITSRIPNPAWWNPKENKVIPFGDTNNVLGTYWLGLNKRGYGLHGTWEPDSIGKQSSAGCVRLLNDDVAELFLLLPVGTPVTIHE